MQGKEKHYLACATSAKGFISLFDSNMEGLKKLYILKGGPGTGLSTLMKYIGAAFQAEGLEVEYIHSCQDPESLDGVVFRSIGVGIVDGTAPHVMEPRLAGAVEEYVNLGTAWDTSILEKSVKEIADLNLRIQASDDAAYKEFAKALLIHDDWERIYIRSINFSAAEELSKEVLKEILGGVKKQEGGSIRHRFFGGSTPNGPMDFITNLTEPMEKRYFIKGRPGSGKSTMLRKILKKAEYLGLDVEVYHCGLDPDSLDMLLFPQLKTCIFDSTAPHEYDPSREGDQVIDMYQRIIRFGTDEENEESLEDIKRRYKEKTKEGTKFLAEGRALRKELESYYEKATDFDMVQQITKELLYKINKYKIKIGLDK